MTKKDFYSKAEFFTPDEIFDIQKQRFINVLNIIKNTKFSNFYQQKILQHNQNKLTLDNVIAKFNNCNNKADFYNLFNQLIPFTTKQDLRENYPDKLCCFDKKNYVRLHCSSGTTGNPTAIFYTKADLDKWADLMARSLFVAGVRPDDVFQNMSGYGLFTGGLGIHQGAEKLGCLTIPAGAGNSKRQIKLLQDFGVTVIHILPSYALHIAEIISEYKKHQFSNLRIAIVGAEPYSEESRQRIQNALGVKVFNNFGLSEMNGPGVGIECQQQNGIHIWEDAFIAEIINPQTCEILPNGEIGELVLTTLTREGMPILRYRTRDLTKILGNDCPCGRNHLRIDRILGRSDDMFIVRGVNIFPMQIENILMNFQQISNNYVIMLQTNSQSNLDDLHIKVEIKNEFFSEDIRQLQNLQKAIESALHDEILVRPIIELVQHNSLPKSDGKVKRVIDLRQK